MSSPFTPAPPPSGTFKSKDHQGELVIMEPFGIQKEIMTEFGLTDAIQAQVTIVDGAHAGEIIAGALIFPIMMQNQLRGQMGKKVLGRVGQGVPKGSQSPPWILLPATEADIAKATDFVTRQTSGQFASAAAPSPAPAGRQGFNDDPPF